MAPEATLAPLLSCDVEHLRKEENERGAVPTRNPDGATFEIYAMNADGTQQPNLSNHPAVFETSPVWSPDGRI